MFKKADKRKVLRNVEKAGLLSKVEELGVTLSSLETLGLLSKSEDLRVPSLAERATIVSPAVLPSQLCHLFSIAASTTIAGCAVDFLSPQPAALLSPPPPTTPPHQRPPPSYCYSTRGTLRVGTDHVSQWDMGHFFSCTTGSAPVPLNRAGRAIGTRSGSVVWPIRILNLLQY